MNTIPKWLYKYNILLLLVSVAATILSSCQSPHAQDGQSDAKISSDFRTNDNALNFYVLGDWGRNGAEQA